jgi:hypothetical protein
MTRARDIADQQDNLGGAVSPVVAGKNVIINGGFDFAQRGTSFTIGATAAYTLDRWYASGSGGSTTSTVSQQTTGAHTGTTAQMRVAYNTNTTFCNVFTPLEYQNLQPLQGRTITLSFKGRRNASYVNGLVAGIQTGTVANTLTGGTWTEVANCVISNANLPTGTSSSDWGSASVTFALPAGTQGLRIRVGEETFQSSGAYYEITGVQLEVGSAVTPFSRAGGTIGGELALCQRYFELQDWNINTFRVATVYANANTANNWIPFLVQKRTLPTIAFGNNGTFRYVSNNGVNNNITLGTATIAVSGVSINTSQTFGTAGAGWIDGMAASGHFVSASAEL